MNADAPGFTYSGDKPQPSFSVSPAAVPAGTDALVTIDTTSLSLGNGYAGLGFGTSDVLVRQVWVVSSTRLLASVSVASTAAQSTTNATLTNGLYSVTQPQVFATTTAAEHTLSMSSSVVNASTGGKAVYPGSAVSLYVLGTSGPLAKSVVVFSINDNAVQPAFPADDQLWFVMPSDTKPGPVIFKLQVDGQSALPIVIPVVPEPPHITAVAVNSGALDPKVPVKQGDLLTLTVTALAKDGTVVDPTQVTITVGGVSLKAADVKALDKGHAVMFALPGGVPTGTVDMTVSIGGLTSAPYPIPTQ